MICWEPGLREKSCDNTPPIVLKSRIKRPQLHCLQTWGWCWVQCWPGEISLTEYRATEQYPCPYLCVQDIVTLGVMAEYTRVSSKHDKTSARHKILWISNELMNEYKIKLVSPAAHRPAPPHNYKWQIRKGYKCKCRYNSWMRISSFNNSKQSHLLKLNQRASWGT